MAQNMYYCHYRHGVIHICCDQPIDWHAMTHNDKPKIINAPNSSVAKRIYETELKIKEWKK